jgi:hypothetical protein
VSRDVSDGLVKTSSDENHTLAACTRKGRRGSLGRRDSLSREASHQDERRILVISYVLSVMIMLIIIHSDHIGRGGEEGNKHQQRRLMRLQIGFRGRSFCLWPFRYIFLQGELVGG